MAYRQPDGQLLHTVPEDLDLLEQCEVGAQCGGRAGLFAASRLAGCAAATLDSTTNRSAPRQAAHPLPRAFTPPPPPPGCCWRSTGTACPVLSLQVVYETLPGWKQDISKVRTWEDLPENARR